MALDGIILQKCAAELQKKLPIRINRISETSNTTLIFNIHAQQERMNLVLSFHSIFNRITLSKKHYPSEDNPSGFLMLLRKHLLNGVIYQIEQRDFDRYLLLHIHARDELYDERHFLLSVELMGKYANLILVDEDTGKILDAFKRIPPFENNQRPLLAGIPFEVVAPQEKMNPYHLERKIDLEESLVKQISGFSKLLETEVRYRLSQGIDLLTILELIQQSEKLYVSQSQLSQEYHVIPLTHLSASWQEYSIFEGLEEVYFKQEERNSLKEKSGNLYRFIQREQKHYHRKISKLQESYQNCLQLEVELEAGNLLYTFGNLSQKGLSECRLLNAEGKEKVIPLNPRFSIKENAQKYFQAYQKKRKGKEHILSQLEIAQNEAEYFDSLAEQLQFASIEETTLMQDELVKNGYLKEQKQRKNKKVKEKKIRVYCIHYQGAKILFGKNNLQNDYLTFKLAKNTDLWFHAKDYHGAHVVVENNNPSEELLRLCANIAAYYSQGRYSSSVPVDYTLIKNVKRIKGAKAGFVSLSHQKTIYIDPEERKDIQITII